MSESGDGWTVVGRDGKFWRPDEESTCGGGHHRARDTSCDAQGSTSTAEGCLKHVSKLQKFIEDSKFYSSLRTAIAQSDFEWTKVRCIRCYGLGCPTKSIEARCQLALLKLLSKTLGPQECQCLVYDPVFEDVDKEVIRQLGGDVLSDDGAGEHAVSEPVLFYMPHCDASLYSDVLDENWSKDALACVAVLGNSFAHMQERWSTPTFKRRVGKPTRVLPLVDHSIVTEHKLPTGSFAVATAFNDTSLHWFSRERLGSVPEIFRA